MVLKFASLLASAIAATILLGGGLSAAMGQAQGEFAVFNDYDPEATTSYVYKDWDDFLHAVVFDVGPSHRFRARTAIDIPTGTKLGTGSTGSASWMESNRIRFHLFNDETAAFLKSTQDSMVEVAENQDISAWNRDEQLAYWLNMHNLLVMQVAVDTYPYSSAKRMHRRFWAEDMVTIKGVALSIEDIRDEIVLAIWDDPMVIYGFFQAAVGGPSLRALALRGPTINLSLQRNGEEFVNSFRGVHARGKTALVSEFYSWTSRAFPNFEVDLRRHLYSLADQKTVEIMDKSKRIKANYITWSVPDFFSGRPHGTGLSSSSSAMTALDGAGTSDSSVSLTTQTLTESQSYLDISAGARLPVHTRLLLAALRRKFKIYDMSNRGITNSEMLSGGF